MGVPAYTVYISSVHQLTIKFVVLYTVNFPFINWSLNLIFAYTVSFICSWQDHFDIKILSSPLHYLFFLLFSTLKCIYNTSGYLHFWLSVALYDKSLKGSVVNVISHVLGRSWAEAPVLCFRQHLYNIVCKNICVISGETLNYKTEAFNIAP